MALPNTQPREHKVAQLPRARIMERKDLNPYLWVMKLKPEIDFPFKAGQYITIGVDGLERAYSIVSAPDEPLIELFIELVPPPDGNLTPVLHKLRVGDTVSMRPRAKGMFTLETKVRNHVLVATVTGIAPYVSMLRTYLRDNNASNYRFYVLHGGSYRDELIFRDEIERIAAARPKEVYYVPTLSRPKEERNLGWKGEVGRVNGIVEKYLGLFGLDAGETVIYTCGHPGMIVDVKEKLVPKGWKVKEERYWKE